MRFGAAQLSSLNAQRNGSWSGERGYGKGASLCWMIFRDPRPDDIAPALAAIAASSSLHGAL